MTQACPSRCLSFNAFLLLCHPLEQFLPEDPTQMAPLPGRLLWVVLLLLKDVLKSSPVSENVPLFGNWATADVIKLR